MVFLAENEILNPYWGEAGEYSILNIQSKKRFIKTLVTTQLLALGY